MSSPRGDALYDAMKGNPYVDRIAWFSHGFFKMSERDGRIIITDLRMGQEPYYSFNFVVGQRQSPIDHAGSADAFARATQCARGIIVGVAACTGRAVAPPR